MAACLEDCVLVTLFAGSLLLSLLGEVHAAGRLRRAPMGCRPGAGFCICWLHVPGACGEGDHDSQRTGQHAGVPSPPLTCLQSCHHSSDSSVCGCPGDAVLLGDCPARWHRVPAACAPRSPVSACQVVGGRTIAVDWAVSKTQYQSASAADAPGERTAPCTLVCASRRQVVHQMLGCP